MIKISKICFGCYTLFVAEHSAANSIAIGYNCQNNRLLQQV